MVSTVKRCGALFLCAIMAMGMVLGIMPQNAQAANKNYVVVIDPGHGGDNSGANEYGPIEKDMTLTTAYAMYNALSQYDNVTVYMTRTADQSLSLDERAAFAKNVNADFLFSIHYNASGDHGRYGSEVYTSVAPPYNAQGYQFGVLQLAEMQARGMFIRGVKARRGNDGTDYYGVIRGATARGIPSVIIEHCHLDQPDDHAKCIDLTQQAAYGVADATAVAKYFGLRSTALGVDYSNYPKVNVNQNAVVPATLDELTPPEAVTLTQVSADSSNGEVTFDAAAVDSDDAIIYYDYSIDGGVTFSSPRMPWAGTNAIANAYQQNMRITIPLTPGSDVNVILRAHNMFDRTTLSAPVHVVW